MIDVINVALLLSVICLILSAGMFVRGIYLYIHEDIPSLKADLAGIKSHAHYQMRPAIADSTHAPAAFVGDKIVDVPVVMALEESSATRIRAAPEEIVAPEEITRVRADPKRA
ncbi:MAG: hypothetical protein ACOX4F_08115 [Atopobiaceae bacterium]|jgi:hypothetical protein